MDWVCSSASHVCSNSKMVRFISQVNTLDPPWDRCMVGMMGLLVWISTTHIIFRCDTCQRNVLFPGRTFYRHRIIAGLHF